MRQTFNFSPEIFYKLVNVSHRKIKLNLIISFTSLLIEILEAHTLLTHPYLCITKIN